MAPPKSILLLLLVAVSTVSGWAFTTVQSVRITGQLLCDGVPAKNVSVKLYDQDLFGSDTMDHTRSDENGIFTAEGVEDESTWIDPYISIYHQCQIDNKYEKQICFRTTSVGIPDTHITEGPIPHKTFQLGPFELKNLYGTESDKKCANY